MQTQPDNPEAVWSRHSRRVARKVNLGWWLQVVSTPLVVTGLAGACALLLLRRFPSTPQTGILAASTAGVVAAIGVIAWLVARKRFEAASQSMVRIEAAMKLRNGLSAAKAGISPWPSPPPVVSAGLDWRWQRVLVPPVAALGFLTAGLLIPVSAVSPRQQSAEQPLAWQQIEADLQRLEEDKDVIDQTYIEETKKQLEELKSQDPDEWFSHSSLEATDALKQQHASDLQSLQRELGRAQKAMNDLAASADKMTPAQKDNLMNQLDQAVKNLESGALKPNSELMNQLSKMDTTNLGQIPSDKMEQLRQNMQKAAKAAQECQGDGQGNPENGENGGKGKGGKGGQGDQWSDELNDGGGNGEGDGQGEGNGEGEGDGEGDGSGEDGQQGSGKGNGDVGRGPGHAPGMLGKERGQNATGDLTGIESKDLSRALPGDLLELQNGEHDVDKTARGPQAGGAAGDTGAGGDRVWKESLDPSEQKALKKFFE